MRKTENIINRTGINKTECKKTGHSKENKIPGVKCTPKIELYLSNFKGALHWWNGSLFFLIIILGITLGIFAGCKNIFVPEPPATPEAAGPGGGITVSLRLFTGSARSVMPEMESLTWKITASQGDITISVAEGAYPEFSLSLPVSGTWTFTVRGINSVNDEIFTGSAEQNIESGSTTSISIPLSPGNGMAEGSGATGKLNLTIKRQNVNLMSLNYRIDGSKDWGSPVNFGEGDYTITYESLPVGRHTLDLYFSSNSDKGEFYFCTVAVNIWPGMTSDQWIKTNGEEYITDGGEFVITKEMVNEFVKTMGSVVFVNESVGENTPGTGSIYAPVNSVSKAVDILRKVNPEGKCNGTIMVSGEATIKDEIKVENGEKLTVKGMEADASIKNTSGRVFKITGGSLTLEENITLTGKNDAGNGGAVYVNGGTFTMKNDSKITGSSAQNGGGVYVNGGEFEMTGTAILQGNTATTHGGGVHIFSDGTFTGTFTMNGGTIDGDDANTATYGGGVFVSGGTFNMYGGTITGNTVTESGGGVCISGGTFTMSDGAFISGNTATSSGGGVFVSASGDFTMNGGTIGGSGGRNPNSAENGGGVYIFEGTFTMSDSAVISGNSATSSGGGVYVYETGEFTMEGGTIGGISEVGADAFNHADVAGGGVHVGDGTFTMNGGIITGNTATQNGGGVYVSSTGSFTLGSSSDAAASSPVVSGNTKTGNSRNNVYLDGTILLIEGKLRKSVDSGNIGISMATPGEVFTSYWSKSGLTDTTFFFSDDTKRNVALSGSELSLNLVRVEGGSCTLNNKQVTLSDFWISPYEVTQAEFESIMTEKTNGIDANPSYFQDNPVAGEEQNRRPVENVRWYEAIVYCNLLSMKEGLKPCYTINSSTAPADWGERPDSSIHGNYNDWNSVTCDFEADGYRLPTEAEWEYAARGGQTGIIDNSWDYDYSGSDTINDVAWYGGDSGNSDSKTHEVGKKDANALGLYDMSGNAGEWCWDWRSENYPSNPENPAGPESGEKRVRRGGSINNTPEICNVGNQNSADPWQKGFCFGFRVVRSIR